MTLAQIGPLTAALEALATTVGAGALLGAFAMGAIGLIARWPRKELEERAPWDGCVGGGVGLLLAVLDLVTRYCI